MRRTARILLVAACLLALASGASAQPASPEAPPWQLPATDPEVFYPSPRVDVFADLTFTREPGASVCPDAWWVRNLVAARVIGSDPFTRAPRGVYVGRVSLTLSRTRDGFTSKFTWEMPNGKVYASPRYRHHGGATFLDCKEALEYAIVDLSSKFLILSIELGEKYARKGRPPYCPEPPPSEPRAPAPPCVQPTPYDVDWFKEWPLSPLSKPEPDPSKPAERLPLALRVGFATWVETVASGWGSVGFSGEIGARFHAVSFGVEVHGNPSVGTKSFDMGSVGFSRVTGAVLLCWSEGWFSVCGIDEAGRWMFSPRLAWMPASALYSAVGGRVALNVPVAFSAIVPARMFVHVGVDTLVPIHPARYVGGTGTAFEAAGPAAGLAFGLLFEIPPRF